MRREAAMQEITPPKRPDYLRAALLRALEGMLHDGRRGIRPHHIVFQALENAMETLRKLPDRETAWLRSGGAWPSIIPTAGGYAKADMETQLGLILSSILGAEEEDEVPPRRTNASPGEIDEMGAIFESFRTNLAGTKRRRDWKILCLLAAGKGQKFVARAAGASLETVRQEKLAQCLAIANALSRFMPPEFEGGYGLVA
jgi:hypothetical protein